MDVLIQLWQWILANKKEIIEAILAIIGGASVIVKLTPTLKDDNYLKPLIKWVGKYLAIDKYSPPKVK